MFPVIHGALKVSLVCLLEYLSSILSANGLSFAAFRSSLYPRNRPTSCERSTWITRITLGDGGDCCELHGVLIPWSRENDVGLAASCVTMNFVAEVTVEEFPVDDIGMNIC